MQHPLLARLQTSPAVCSNKTIRTYAASFAGEVTNLASGVQSVDPNEVTNLASGVQSVDPN